DPVQTETVQTNEPTIGTQDTFESFPGTTTSAFPNDLPPYGDTNLSAPSIPAPAPTGTLPPQTFTSQPPAVAVPQPTPNVPADPGASTTYAPQAGSGTVHVVAKGETLSTIAPKYSVSVRAIEEANPGLNPNRLQIGQKLNIPAAGSTTASASAKTSVATTGAEAVNGNYIVYTVKPGDVLERIARNHNTSVQAIKAANGMKTDRINAGQKLKIPSK
ncbi:MAG: LysM peptidoglycan-binding domain-containing protein, partial [Limisphaerales bacterium]